jgi:hypothetical protein
VWLAASPVLAAAERSSSPDTAAFLAEIDTLRREAKIPELAVAVVRDQSVLLAAGLGYLNSGETAPYGLGWYVNEHNGNTLVWHTGWREDACSSLYLNIPGLGLGFTVLANGEGVWWGNPLDQATVERSVFAAAFLEAFVDDWPEATD